MHAPQRIASFISSATEILYGLGLQDRVVAVSHECDFPPAAARKPRVTRTCIAVSAASGDIDRQVAEMAQRGEPLYEIDTELLASLEPDLIVTQAQCDVCAVKYDDVLALVRNDSRFRETRVVALNPLCLEDVFADVDRLGAATGRAEAAAACVAALRERVAAVQAKTVGILPADRPVVACIEWIEPIMIAANWVPELIELAGGSQPFTRAGVHSGYTPWEQILAVDPDCIVVTPCGFDLDRAIDEAEVLFRLPGWSQLKATVNGRVFAVDGNAYFNRSGPRLVDSLEILARLLHPDLFGRPPEVGGQDGVWRRLIES